MKTKFKLIGITALVSVIVLSMTAATCGSKSGSKDGDGGKTAKGSMKWTEATSHPFTGEGSRIIAVAFGADKFVALGNNNDYSVKMAYSTDGKTWTAVTDNVINDIYPKSIAYGGGKFVVGNSSGKMAYSSDGVTWTAVSDSKFGTSTISSIAYGNNMFIAGDDSANHKMAYSTDGVTWKAITDSHYMYVIACGGGKFITGGYTGNLWYSTDVVKWTEVGDSTIGNGGEHIKAIAYGDGKFIAVGDNNSVATSLDGVIWTATESPITGLMSTTIAYGNGKFVLGRSSKVAYSSNGTTWNTVNLESIFSKQSMYSGIFDITFGNGTFVAVGYIGELGNPTAKIAYSTGN